MISLHNQIYETNLSRNYLPHCCRGLHTHYGFQILLIYSTNCSSFTSIVHILSVMPGVFRIPAMWTEFYFLPYWCEPRGTLYISQNVSEHFVWLLHSILDERAWKAPHALEVVSYIASMQGLLFFSSLLRLHYERTFEKYLITGLKWKIVWTDCFSQDLDAILQSY